jgi:hypothetical protein
MRNIWQIISALISVASLGWGIYQYGQRKYESHVNGATIIQLTERLLNSQAAIAAHQATIDFLSLENDTLSEKLNASAEIIRGLQKKAIQQGVEINQLKTKLNEIPVYVSGDHVKSFLLWTK